MREELERRPLVVAFLGLVIGSAGFISLISLLFWIPLILVCKGSVARVTALVACALGWFLYPRIESEKVLEESFYRGHVDVLTMPEKTANARRAIVQADRARYQIYFDLESDFVLGDRLEVRAEVFPLREGQVGRRGAIGTMFPVSSPTVVDEGAQLWRLGLWVSRSFSSMTDQFASPRSAALLDAMCFNMTSDIDDSFMDSMSRTGTTHIVSTSGLHVMLVAFALALALSRLPVQRGAVLFLLFGFLTVYAAASGLRPPVVRAVLMSAVFLTAYVWKRGPDGLSGLAFAGCVSLLLAPELVSDIGFQLSMTAVASLVMFGTLEVSDRAHPVVRTGLQYAWASLVVSLATAPLIAYHFGALSLVSVPANLLILPVLGVVIGGALATWLVWLSLPAAGVFLLHWFVEPLTGWVGAVIESVGRLPFASAALPEFSAYWIVLCFALACLLWRPHVRQA